MKKLSISLSAAAALLCSACVGNAGQDDGSMLLTVNLDEAKPLAEHIVAQDVRALSQTDSLFYGEASICSIVSDTVFILDAYKNKGLYAYTLSGERLWCYDKMGQGPEEFVMLYDFQVLPDRVVALDLMANKLITLGRDGRFMGSEALSGVEYPWSFAVGEGGAMWYDLGNRAKNPERLVCVSDTAVTTVLTVPDGLGGINASAWQPLYTFGGDCSKVRYMPSFENVLYRCSDAKATPYITLDFGDKWPGRDVFESSGKASMVVKQIESDGYVIYLNAIEDAGYVAFWFKANVDRSYMLIVDKTNGRSVLYDFTGYDFDRLYALYDGKLFFPGENEFTLLTVDMP
ncbi:MAG: 6-bladed beta-propeller [Muribaculaceae bacterium]|nr:6-bladed beta-propeller [Muribaculaceae bacterium]